MDVSMISIWAAACWDQLRRSSTTWAAACWDQLRRSSTANTGSPRRLNLRW